MKKFIYISILLNATRFFASDFPENNNELSRKIAQQIKFCRKNIKEARINNLPTTELEEKLEKLKRDVKTTSKTYGDSIESQIRDSNNYIYSLQRFIARTKEIINDITFHSDIKDDDKPKSYGNNYKIDLERAIQKMKISRETLNELKKIEKEIQETIEFYKK